MRYDAASDAFVICSFTIIIIIIIIFLRVHRIPNNSIRLILGVTVHVFINLIPRIIFIFVIVIIKYSPPLTSSRLLSSLTLWHPVHRKHLPRFISPVYRVVSFFFALLIFNLRKEILPYVFSKYRPWTSRHISCLYYSNSYTETWSFTEICGIEWGNDLERPSRGRCKSRSQYSLEGNK